MFAWLVILAGAGMGVSFFFMWTVSILEMWAFDKVFVNDQGEYHPKWSEIVEGKFKQWGGEDLVRKVWTLGKQTAVYSWNQALPLLKAWYHKFKG